MKGKPRTYVFHDQELVADGQTSIDTAAEEATDAGDRACNRERSGVGRGERRVKTLENGAKSVELALEVFNMRSHSVREKVSCKAKTRQSVVGVRGKMNKSLRHAFSHATWSRAPDLMAASASNMT